MNYAYSNLKLAEIQKGNYKQALAFAQLEFAYADSLSSTASKENVRQLEAKYQTEKKEKEIADLTLTKTANELALVKPKQANADRRTGGCFLITGAGITYIETANKKT
ncbi:MAG: hypothetical protein IPK57_09055 [Chitinophagaceae bacterium]|nr:hypothetical protein [Chitinophagaceae bacterium]